MNRPVAIFAGALAFMGVAVWIIPAAPHGGINGGATGPGAPSVAFELMAAHPRRFAGSQFGYRLLTPQIARWLPFGTLTAFTVVTVIALAATAAVLYLFLLEFTTSRIAGLLVVCMIATGGVRDALIVRETPDPMTLLAVIVTFWLLVKGRYGWLPVVLALGVANHDINLALLAPVTVVAVSRPDKWRSWASAAVAPLTVYALLHFTPLWFGHATPTFHYVSARNVSLVLAGKAKAYGSLMRAVGFGLLVSLGPLWVGVCWLPRCDRRLWPLAAYLPAVAGACSIATDWDRIASFAFPVVLACCGQWLDSRRLQRFAASTEERDGRTLASNG